MYNFLKSIEQTSDDVSIAIRQLEDKYDVVFPNILKEYYRKYNNCKIKLCRFFIDEYECEVSKILPIKGDGLTFEKIVENDRKDGFIDSNLYPLASNRGGDIYYWNAATENIELIYSDAIETPMKICDSVSEFFHVLDACE